MQHTATIKTPLGYLNLVEEEQCLIRCFCAEEVFEENITQITPVLEQAIKQLEEYFLGQRQCFDIPLKLEGTDFQKSVWQALRTIPYGEKRSYGQIAKQIDNPKAARAVGSANNKNPLMIFVPCHRVIGANGSMVGYASGIRNKEILLELESSAEYVKK